MTPALERLKRKKVAVWGLGDNFKRKKKFIQEFIAPVMYVDSNAELWKCEISPGIVCISPEELDVNGIEAVVITPESGSVRNELRKQLEKKYEVYVLDYIWDENEMELQEQVDFGTEQERIVKRLSCSLGGCACNIQCSYCYIDYYDEDKKFQNEFKHSIQFILKALSKRRLGGVAYFDIVGDGETLLKPGLSELVYGLLREEHYVKLTTNGTVTKKMQELLSFEAGLIKRMGFSFSLHYLELKKKKLLNTFFDNVNKSRKAGASVCITLVGSDEYVSYIDEIVQICMDQVGFLPQINICESGKILADTDMGIPIATKMTEKEYFATWEKFHSTKFESYLKVWGENFSKCYSGVNSAFINLQSGKMYRCHNSKVAMDNIYEDIKRKILFSQEADACEYFYCIAPCIHLSGMPTSYGRVPTNYELFNRVDKQGIPTINDTFKTAVDFSNRY